MLLTKDSLARSAFYAGKGIKFQPGRLDQDQASRIDTTAMRAVVSGSIDHGMRSRRVYVSRFSTDEVNMFGGRSIRIPSLPRELRNCSTYAYYRSAWFPRKPDASVS